MTCRPNVLLLTVDSLRYDTVTDDTVSTPNFDSIRDNGVDFSRAYASGPYTRASVPAMVSGTHPWMYGGYARLTADRPYMAEAFSQAGYTTAAFHSNPYLSAEFGYDRAFDRFFDGQAENSLLGQIRRYVTRTLPKDSVLYRSLRWAYKRGEETTGMSIGMPYISGERLNEQVFDWLAENTDPAFCWVHYMDVHHPYVPHEDTASAGIEKQRAIRLRQKMIESPETLSEEGISTLKELYRGEIEYTDICIGELLDELERYWDMDDTVILLAADHGEAFGEHEEFGHSDILYDEVTRVPFAIHTPERDSNCISSPVSGVDILPTLLDEASIDYDRTLNGISAFQVPKEDRIVFAVAGQPDGGNVMAVEGGWKLTTDTEMEDVSLFDIEGDPQESKDVSERNEGVVGQFLDEVVGHITFVEESTDSVSRPEVSSDVENRLQELGYQE
ncbi:Arylsulfatase A [Halomicrobium zhouii]|uniref:Arylsulfatase A n=1 Tax=Halomicrobium zhouii TaxID=767519 RepID=A0A1I6KFU1_9EURY|nr:sulfatase [Halomicrobium zhouii]SFR90112.1 Arylsulfatase A [Halomicrobium zhouii]